MGVPKVTLVAVLLSASTFTVMSAGAVIVGFMLSSTVTIAVAEELYNSSLVSNETKLACEALVVVYA